MQIVRIEHPETGCGLFRSYYRTKKGNVINHFSKLPSDMQESIFNKHKSFLTPFEDKKLGCWLDEDEVCGFKSVRQLKYWLTKEQIKEVISIGFKVYLINIGAWVVREGKQQIVFDNTFVDEKTDISKLFI